MLFVGKRDTLQTKTQSRQIFGKLRPASISSIDAEGHENDFFNNYLLYTHRQYLPQGAKKLNFVSSVYFCYTPTPIIIFLSNVMQIR